MFGTRFNAAVAIALVGLLLPEKGAASERPSLISHVTSPAVRDMPSQARHGGELEEKERPHREGRSGGDVVDPVVQTSTPTAAAAQGLGQWEGLGAGYPGFTVTAVPPDPNIAVGPNHIVQWVNNAFIVFDKSSGQQIINPVSDDTFWGGLSGTCDQLGGYSDPIVQYDRVADRWLVGEVAIPLLPGLFGQFVLLHVDVRLPRHNSGLSEDRHVAGRLLRDVEHVSGRWRLLQWCRGVCVEPR